LPIKLQGLILKRMFSVCYLFVDLNSYFAAVEQQLHPELRSRPVAVIPTPSDYTSCIAASYEAKAYGIKTGTLVKEAKRLCPNIAFRLANHRHYVEYHEKIMAAIEACHPIQQILSIDECVLKLGGRDQKLENAIKLAHEIRGSILNLGNQLKCSIGISTNRFLAKVASDMQKPNGLSYILKSDIPEKLYRLKLEDFPGIGSRMLHRLNLQGIQTTKELYQQDLHSLRQIWGGIVGERFYHNLRGVEVETPYTPRAKSVGQSHVLAPEFRSPEGAYKIAVRLLQKAAFRLRETRAWTRHLHLALRFENGGRWKSELAIHETQDSLSLIQNLNQLWNKKPNGNPKKVSLVLTHLIYEDEKNASFFDRKKREELSHAMDKINRKFGKNILYFAASHDAIAAAKNRIAFSKIPDFDFDEN